MDTAAPALKPAEKPNSSNHTDGDHDSGVDENTQRKDGPTTNGDLTSPSKSPSKIPAPKKLSTLPSPTKSSKASPKTPEAPPTAEKKKVPMNKIQVGAAPSPNLKTVKSKIGSLQNATHKPGGGNVKIENRKLDWRAEPRIAAKNDAYQPGGGDKKIPQVKLKWEAKPKVGSLDNATHKPGGGEKKIESVKLDFKEKAKPKVGSKDNMKHQPGGGNVKTPSQDGSQDGNPGDIEDQKLEVKAQSKIGSLDNVKHKPGGGDRKIFDDKDYLRQMSGATSRAASEGIPSGTQDGWSSAGTSRRTSRDRRTSGDRRYRSESRLGLRTPEPRMGVSPKEEHCSLWERHDKESKCLARVEDQDLGGQEMETPTPVTPKKEMPSSDQTIVKNTGEDKDLNSNKPVSCPVAANAAKEIHESSSDKTIEGKDKKENQINPKETEKTMEKDTCEAIAVTIASHVLHKKQTVAELKESIKTQEKPQQVKNVENSSKVVPLNNDLPKTNKEENINKLIGLETVTSNTKQMMQNQNVYKKPESKEDMVKEIKEIDSKEAVGNQNGVSNLPNNVNSQSNPPDGKVAVAGINTPLTESTVIKHQIGGESKLT